MNTLLDGLGRSDLVLSSTKLVQSLLGFQHDLDLELVVGVQVLLLASAVTEVLVDSSHSEDGTQHLNEHPRPASVTLLLWPLVCDALGSHCTTMVAVSTSLCSRQKFVPGNLLDVPEQNRSALQRPNK